MLNVRVPASATAAGVALLLAGCLPPQNPPNPAQPVTDTITVGLASVRPNVFCSNGDAGLGLDNDVPWFVVYLVVDQRADLDQTLTNAAAKAGFHLAPDVARTSHSAQPSTSFLAATDNGRSLGVEVDRGGEMAARCRNLDQSALVPVQPGKAAVIIQVDLPER